MAQETKKSSATPKAEARATVLSAASRDKKTSAPAPTPKKASGGTAKRPISATGTQKKTTAKGGKGNPAAAQKGKSSRPKKEQDGTPNSAKPLHRIMPLLLIVFAVFLGMSLLLNLFCNPDNILENDPSAHWMGYVGYYLCYGLFGMFGPAVFVLPILLFNLAFFWKRYVDNRLATSKTIVSLLFLLLLSAFIHTFSLIGNLRDIPAGELIRFGAKMTGGGLLGGKVAYFMVSLLNVTGTIVLSLCLLVAALFYCLGMTPQYLWNLYRTRRAEKRAEEMARQDLEHFSEQAAAATHGNTEPEQEHPEPKSPERKKTPTDKIAPMPMPHLDPSNGTRPFVPADVTRKLSEEALKNGETPASPSASNTAAHGSSNETEVAEKNRDDAIDPIFPKSNEAKQMRKVPRQDRNFDLKNVFIELEDGSDAQERPHTTLPPEVPLANAASASATPAPTAPTPRPTAKVGSVGGQAKPKTATAASSAGKTVYGEIDTESQEYGLTSEEFEKLEAAQGISTGAKTATAKPTKVSSGNALPPKVEMQNYVFPSLSLLHPGEPMTSENKDEIEANQTLLTETLNNFNVRTMKIDHAYGPTVTRYEVFPAPGVRVRAFVNLADDIALALAAGGIRIEAPIPGKSAVGIEVPNKTRSTVYLRELLESKNFTEASGKLTACLGADIAGKPLVFDISKMPHLLVAGTTGSGKSVCINCTIMSLLYKANPQEVKLVLIDPKKVEFSIYKNIPHLMAPIVTTPKDAAGALQASVEEMEHRFELFEQVGVHDLKGYNEMTKNDPDMPYLPHIVIIIDELADLMMTAPDEVETAICRIAQKARAAGMHLIVGTQRPSVDVVTGLIKSNIPSRIAFTVASQVDSKTILDYAGAEKLAGRGDMLFAPIGALKPARVQGAYVDEKEVERVCDFLRSTNGLAQYDEKFISKLKELAAQCGNRGKGGGGGADLASAGDGGDGKSDSKYADAVRVAVEEKRISTSLLQRKLEIGYGRAAKIIDRMQAEGIVSAPDGAKPRSVLITPEEYIARFVDKVDEEEVSVEDLEEE